LKEGDTFQLALTELVREGEAGEGGYFGSDYGRRFFLLWDNKLAAELTRDGSRMWK